MKEMWRELDIQIYSMEEMAEYISVAARSTGGSGCGCGSGPCINFPV